MQRTHYVYLTVACVMVGRCDPNELREREETDIFIDKRVILLNNSGERNWNWITR